MRLRWNTPEQKALRQEKLSIKLSIAKEVTDSLIGKSAVRKVKNESN